MIDLLVGSPPSCVFVNFFLLPGIVTLVVSAGQTDLDCKSLSLISFELPLCQLVPDLHWLRFVFAACISHGLLFPISVDPAFPIDPAFPVNPAFPTFATINMRVSMDVEAKTPLLDKRAYPEAEMAAGSMEMAFPMRERPIHTARLVLTFG